MLQDNGKATAYVLPITKLIIIINNYNAIEKLNTVKVYILQLK